MADVSLEMIQALVEHSLEGQNEMRRDTDDTRRVIIAALDQGRRIERRVEELRDDLEPMIKAELMGRVGHFETRIEARMEALGREA